MITGITVPPGPSRTSMSEMPSCLRSATPIPVAAVGFDSGSGGRTRNVSPVPDRTSTRGGEATSITKSSLSEASAAKMDMAETLAQGDTGVVGATVNDSNPGILSLWMRSTRLLAKPSTARSGLEPLLGS